MTTDAKTLEREKLIARLENITVLHGARIMPVMSPDEIALIIQSLRASGERGSSSSGREKLHKLIDAATCHVMEQPYYLSTKKRDELISSVFESSPAHEPQDTQGARK